MDFANTVKGNNYQNLTRTENDAVALKSTESALLDLFATAGALRRKSYDEVAQMFDGAFLENNLLATKLMFYTRNIRGGLGERDAFRSMLHRLADINPHIVELNMGLIPHFGRWDDLYALIDTPCEWSMWGFMQTQFFKDLADMREGKNISLLSKWMKSVNTSSKKSVALGKLTAKNMGLTQQMYRIQLARLRKYLKVVEQKMSADQWQEIEYGSVPSGAMKNYRNAFARHDPEGFSKFMEKVESGEETIKATTLYPYDILMRSGLRAGYSGSLMMNRDRVLEAQWKALPNYIEGENNVLVMADTSGSMNGQPIATSVGLAIYFAERNRGAYKDLFMTFSRNPKFVELSGESLYEKATKIQAEVANTNLEAAFDLILEVAIRNNVSQEEMPKSLVIISDMHFDQAIGSGSMLDTFYQKMKNKFSENGYQIPTVIFWNVEQREEAFQVGRDQADVILVSGQSTSTFRNILANIGRTPYEFMLETLNGPEYDVVKI